MVMKGYLNNPEATRLTIDDDGWLHTGDIAVLDDHEHVSIVDRVKELIKYKGFQVPPAELEALIVTHPKVADVAVIGVPDVEAGELPKAFVVVPAGRRADRRGTAGLRRRARGRRTSGSGSSSSSTRSRSRPSGKILRRLLRDQICVSDHTTAYRHNTRAAGCRPISFLKRERSTAEFSAAWQAGHHVIERCHGVWSASM